MALELCTKIPPGTPIFEVMDNCCAKLGTHVANVRPEGAFCLGCFHACKLPVDMKQGQLFVVIRRIGR